jgi:hypothetical protein
MLVASAAVTLMTARAEAATGTVYVRGTVTCPVGQPFMGTWVASSVSGSGWASKAVYPGTSSRMAKISRTLSNVAVPTTVSLNVGCGGTSSSWRYAYNRLGNVKASATGTVFINLVCTTSRCTTAPRGLAGSTARNPVSDPTQCTYRAAEFWKQMAGSYPSWGGNAGYWDDNAPTKGWAVRGWAEPDSLIVWQPTTGNPYGHVGYVADTRVVNGVTQVKIYDRNYDFRGTNRNGVWLNLPAGVRFIRVPPRFTPYNR